VILSHHHGDPLPSVPAVSYCCLSGSTTAPAEPPPRGPPPPPLKKKNHRRSAPPRTNSHTSFICDTVSPGLMAPFRTKLSWHETMPRTSRSPSADLSLRNLREWPTTRKLSGSLGVLATFGGRRFGYNGRIRRCAIPFLRAWRPSQKFSCSECASVRHRRPMST
jgi:hypothetical protein